MKNQLSRYKRSFSDYLWLGVLLSVLTHGGLLYYSWPSNTNSHAHYAEPEIVLINYKNDEVALDALLFAQWQAAGGGTGKANDVASAPFSGTTTPTPSQLVLQALRERLRQAEDHQKNRLLQLESEWQSLQAKIKMQNDHSTSDQATTQKLTDQALQLAQELHVLRNQLSHYNAKPRVHFDAPSTKASAFAAYIEDWRAKIERLGTEHYPEQAKGLLSDALQLTVYIDQEGKLLKIDINQAANNPIFTVAAQRIVRLAAPFGPFSPQMLEQTDVLAITRSWRFTQGALTTY